MGENFTSLKKYNFWDGNVPKLGFLRKDYTDKIFDSTRNNLIKDLVTALDINWRILSIWSCEEPDMKCMSEHSTTKGLILLQKKAID